VRSLALQLVRRRHPEWRGEPLAVVARPGAHGELTHVDAVARRLGVRVGMRLGPALSLTERLRADTCPPAEVAAAVAAITDVLRAFSPGVEPSPALPGVLWLQADGLRHLAPSLDLWARGLREALSRDGLAAAVAVGFTRFGAFAGARACRSWVVFERPGDEQAAAHAVRLGLLGLPPRTLAELDKLTIRTVGDLLALPAAGVRRRFGAEAYALHRAASDVASLPLQAAPEAAPVLTVVHIEPAEQDSTRLLFIVRRELHGLLRVLARRGADVRQVVLRLSSEGPRPEVTTTAVGPAAPTRDEGALLELLRLRLDALPLHRPIATVALELVGSDAAHGQLELFAEQPRRDPDAADQSLARVRAELGDGAVVRARLSDGVLPEDRYTWEPLAVTPRDLGGAPLPERPPPLVRRLRGEAGQGANHRPGGGPPQGQSSGHGARGWAPLGAGRGEVVELGRPTLLSGGWWDRAADREYRYAILSSGDVVWLCFDRIARRWSVAGTVE
jgi:protein ImuB